MDPVITNIGGGRLKDPVIQAPYKRVSPQHRLAGGLASSSDLRF